MLPESTEQTEKWRPSRCGSTTAPIIPDHWLCSWGLMGVEVQQPGSYRFATLLQSDRGICKEEGRRYYEAVVWEPRLFRFLSTLWPSWASFSIGVSNNFPHVTLHMQLVVKIWSDTSHEVQMSQQEMPSLLNIRVRKKIAGEWVSSCIIFTFYNSPIFWQYNHLC